MREGHLKGTDCSIIDILEDIRCAEPHSSERNWQILSKALWPMIRGIVVRQNLPGSPREIHAAVLEKLFTVRKFPRFRSRSGLQAYVWRTVRCVAQRPIPQIHSAGTLENCVAGGNHPTIPEKTVLRELTKKLLAELDANERQLLVLLLSPKKNHSSIACELHIKSNHLAVQLSRLKKRVREILLTESRAR